MYSLHCARQKSYFSKIQTCKRVQWWFWLFRRLSFPFVYIQFYSHFCIHKSLASPTNQMITFLSLYCFQFIFPFFQFLVLCSADVGSEGGSGCLILRQRPNCSLSRPSSHFVAIWPSGSLKSSHKIVTKIVVQINMEILHCSFSLWAWKDINCEINVS